MKYWIHIFDSTSTIKLRTIESSYQIWVEAIEGLLQDLEMKASSLAAGEYMIVISSTEDFKNPPTAEDHVMRISKIENGFRII